MAADKRSLFVNASMLSDQPTGIGVYAESMVQSLANQYSCTVATSLDRLVPGARQIVRTPKFIAIGQHRWSAAARLVYYARFMPVGTSPVYSPTQHGLGNTANQVITIHDLICLDFPNQHPSQHWYFTKIMPKLLLRCRAVFTVSSTIKEQIFKIYGYPLDDIHIVPNSVDRARFTRSGTLQDAPATPFLLVVGASFHHKNIQELLSVAELWKDRFKLKIVSARGAQKETLARIVAEKGLENDVSFLGYVSNEDLQTLYQNCHALVYPSFVEGFGIPPLEALASGALVIAADIPVLREVLQMGAIFVKLGDVNSWKQALDASFDSKTRAEKMAFGAQRVLKFSKENAESELYKALGKVFPELETII